jgi:hypothetical protein
LAERRVADRNPAMTTAAPASPSPSRSTIFIPARGGRAWGGGPLKISSLTGAPVTVPEPAASGAFGPDRTVGAAVLSLARATRGVFRATSVAAPLLVVPTRLSAPLVGVATRVSSALPGVAAGSCDSLTRRGCWGAGCAGLPDVCVCLGAEAG